MVIDFAEVLDNLEPSRKNSSVFRMLFSLLDDALLLSLRQQTALDLERSLGEDEIFEAVRAVLYAQPLPTLAPCESALEIALGLRVVRLSRLLQGLRDDQATIGLARQAWESIPADLLLPTDRPPALRVAVEEGLFSEFVHAFRNQRPDSFHFQALSCLKGIANHRGIVEHWCQALPHPVHAHPRLVVRDGEWEEKSRSHRKKGGVDRGRAFDSVRKIKGQIIALFQQRPLNTVEVERLLAWLRRLHEDTGNEKLLSKSLTDLAVRAKEAGVGEYHLRLAGEAVEANGADGIAWTVWATALRSQGRLQESLAATIQSIDFGSRLYGMCGKAETLKEMNLLAEALTAYDEAIGEFPENVVARTGRAETLKVMNRLGEALEAYDGIIEEFPENVVARTGRGETLKAMNRLEEALDAYDQVILEFPENAVARTGRGETLKAMNRLDEALTAFVEVIEKFPENVFAHTGRGETLKAMNRLADALAVYDQIILEFPGDVVVHNGRGEILKAMNRLEDALAAYDQTIEAFPWDVVARNGRAETLKAMNRLEEALVAYEAIIREFPENLVARTGRGETLKAMNRLEDALMAYRAVGCPRDTVARNGQAGVLLAMGLVEEAVAVLGLPEQPMSRDDWIGVHILGGIHLHRGELREAEEIFRRGLENSLPNQRDYFRSGLAATHLRMGEFDQVERGLSTVHTPQLEIPVLLLRIHLHGLTGKLDQIGELLKQVKRSGPSCCHDYSVALERHFNQKLPMNGETLFQMGACCLALAA